MGTTCTNGLEFLFVEKEQKRFEIKCNPIGDWPMAEESVGTKDVVSDAYIRVADGEMLKITFRRCHNFIHGNEGMSKDAAFWQFLYLIFCKMHDESLRAMATVLRPINRLLHTFRPTVAVRRPFYSSPKPTLSNGLC